MKAPPGTLRHTPPSIPSDLAPYIDHTLLKPDASDAAIEVLCREALTHGFFAVCVNGAHVATAKRLLTEQKSVRGTHVAIAAVVGFPLGAMSSAAKAFETEQAIADGATEIDMVMRIDLAKTARWEDLRADIAAVIRAARDRALVKVILETSLLTSEEIVQASRMADQAGAHFVKTCTGFSTAGTPAGVATVEHVALMKSAVGPTVQVKASGGVKTFEAATALIAAGATRLGTSSGVALIQGRAPGVGY